jgi:hypothetical protein
MSRITVGGLEICDLSAGYWSEIVAGGLDDLASFRGEDDVVAEASGRDPGQWIADTRTLQIHTFVLADSATSYRSRMDALLAKMDPATLVTVVVYAPLFGLGTGQTATLANCRPRNVTGPPAMGDQGRDCVLELVCIDSPPEWTVA